MELYLYSLYVNVSDLIRRHFLGDFFSIRRIGGKFKDLHVSSTKVCGEEDQQFASFLISTFYVREVSGSRPGRFIY
jgi:hypothetical protein